MDELFEALGELISAADNITVKKEDIARASYYLDDDGVFRSHSVITVNCFAKRMLRFNEVLEWARDVYRKIDDNHD